MKVVENAKKLVAKIKIKLSKKDVVEKLDLLK
jgi:hypothetical protein